MNVMEHKEMVRISARMPKDVIDGLIKLHPKENISGILRSLAEKEVTRERVRKAHMRLYGRFKPEDFDESLL